MTLRLCLLGSILLLALSLAGPAAAGRPGRWDVVAAGPQAPTVSQELGIARTADGVLHVAWRQAFSDVLARPITPAGQLGATTTIVSGWDLGADPTLLAQPGGIRVFFAAVTPIEGLLTATAPGAAGPWTAPGLVESSELARGRTAGVTAAPDGTPIQAWYSVGDIVVHRGLTPGGVNTLAPGGTNVRPDIVTGSDGRVWVAWCSFATGGRGVVMQQVDPTTGAPNGGATALPGSTTEYQGSSYPTCVLESEASRREPIAARVGGGVFVAGAVGYPNLDRVLVWRVGGTAGIPAAVVASAKNVAHSEPAIAAAPDGRIWVAWLEPAGAGKRLVARRSNRAASVFGSPVTAVPPDGLLGTVNLSAQASRLDVLGIVVSVGGAHTLRHTQLLPGLTLVRRAVVRHRNRTASVTFAVLDAGDPVAGARVSAGGRSAVTGAAGKATLVLRSGGVAKATKAGYVAASARFGCC